MKKLLSILSSITLVTSSVSASVVSCGTTNKNNNDEDDKVVVKEFSDTKILHSGDTMEYTKDFNTGYRAEQDLSRSLQMGTPFAKYWMPEGQKLGTITGYEDSEDKDKIINDFLSYDPNKDADAKYNVATVKLADRFATQGSNEYQDKTGKVKLLDMGVANTNTSGSPAQGQIGLMDNYNLTNWQYIDTYVGWAGANNEGIIVLPSPDFVDSAHTNGARVLGMIYFDGFHGLTQELIEHFFDKNEKGEYKIVDKLIEVADYYGFDGWFWNDEANAGGQIVDEKDVTNVMKEYTDKVKQNQKNQIIIGYSNVANLNDFKGDFAKDVITNADGFLGDFGTNIGNVDEFFNDPENVNLKDKRFDAYSMVNVNNLNGQLGKTNLTGLVKNDEGKFVDSMALFAAADTWKDFATKNTDAHGVSANINKVFHDYDNQLYAGNAQNPTLINPTSDNRSVAEHIIEKSVLNTNEFVSDFSTGQGSNYYTQGKKISTNLLWDHRGVTDIMPTFQWDVKNEGGNKLSADFDYNNGWNKGNSIGLSSNNFDYETSTYNGGTIAANGKTTLNLFDTNIANIGQTLSLKAKASIGLQDIIRNGDGDINIAIQVEYENKTIKEYNEIKPVFQKSSENWYSYAINLDKNLGKLTNISLVVKGKKELNNIKVNFGEIALTNEDSNKKVDFVEDMTFEYVIKQDDTYDNVRMFWERSNQDIVDRYEIFQINENGNYTWLGSTRTNAFFLENVDKNNGTKIAIKAVSKYDSNIFKTTIRPIKF